MAEITYSLATLRRAIARESRMPFARRFATGYSAMDAGSTTTNIIDAALTQKESFWSNQWFYAITTMETSRIFSFQSKTNSFGLEVPLAATPAAGDTYEIHSIWNANDIHAAINRAIKLAGRSFPKTVTDETLILREDVLAYSLSAFAETPWIINKIWIESIGSGVTRGTLVSATSTSATVENSGILTGVDSNWKMSIYAGTGAGQIRNITTVSGAQANMLAWTTTPDSTSKYALWNPTEQLVDWYPTNDWHTDSIEFMDTLYLHVRNPAFYGLRLRVEYLTIPTALTTEAGVTIIPDEYIVPKALSILYGQGMNDTKADKDMMFAEHRRYMEEADAYLVRNAPRMPGIAIRNPSEGGGYYDVDNPMAWNYGNR